jgi:hypothetical protein
MKPVWPNKLGLILTRYKALKVTFATIAIVPQEPDGERMRRRWIEECREIAAVRAELLNKVSMRETASKLLLCLSNVKISSYRGRAEVIRLNRCSLRFICPICHYFWADEHAKKYSLRLKQLVHQGYKPFLLTLPMPSVDVLTEEAIKVTWVCWKKLRHQKLFKGCIGALAIAESVKSVNGWLVHLHIILIVDSIIREELISIEWFNLSGGHQVNIKPIEIATVERLIRYTMKDPEIEHAEDLRALYRATKGHRLVRATGQARRTA